MIKCRRRAIQSQRKPDNKKAMKPLTRSTSYGNSPKPLMVAYDRSTATNMHLACVVVAESTSLLERSFFVVRKNNPSRFTRFYATTICFLISLAIAARSVHGRDCCWSNTPSDQRREGFQIFLPLANRGKSLSLLT